MRISRHVLAITLAALSAASLVTVALAFSPQARSLFGLKNRYNADFAITSSPSTTSLDAGASTTVITTLTGANGFSGTVSLTSTVSPSTGGAFSASPTPSLVNLSQAGTGSSTINLSTTSAVAPGSYTITVVGASVSLSKSVSIIVRVLPAGSDFSISNPIGGIMVVSQGWSSQAGVTLSGIGGFSGDISLATTVSPSTNNRPTVTLSAYDVMLSVGGSSTPTASISTTSKTTAGDYTLTILGVSGSLSHSLSIPFIIKSNQENVIVENHVFNSCTNVTLDLRNVSTAPVSLVSYNVTDSLGDTYYAATWTGPNMAANSIGTGNILIGSSCGSACRLTGSPFTFTAGYTYTVTVATSHNNQFPFSVKR